MAYVPKEWECGETITADSMNNLEDGIQEALECCGGGAPLILTFDHYDEDEDKTYYEETYSEVLQALQSGRRVLWITDFGSEDSVQVYEAVNAMPGGGSPEYIVDFISYTVDYYDGTAVGATAFLADALNGQVYRDSNFPPINPDDPG